MVEKMGRGINLGNVLSAPIEGNWAPAFTESYFQDVATAGFTTVRIPMDFFGTRTNGDTSVYSKDANTSGNYNGSAADYIVNSAYLDRIEQVINWGLNQNLVVILDFHGNTLKSEYIETFSETIKENGIDVQNTLYTHPTSAKRAADNDKFRAIWSQIANRLKNYSYDLIFEIINEPYFNISANEMDTINTDIISIIRASGGNNPSRNIIITGGGANSWQAPLQVSPTILTGDSYLIPTFHYYLPFKFTSSSRDNVNDVETWGSQEDKYIVDYHFEQVQTWAQNNNLPVLLGEFGADNEGGYNYSTMTYGNFGGPENASRVAYHEYLAEKAISLGFAFTAWDAGDESNKTIYKVSDRSWVEDVKDALLGNTLNIIDFENPHHLYVFPNPTTNTLFFNTNEIVNDIKLYNSEGKQLWYCKPDSKNLHLPNLAPDLYYLKFYFKNNTVETKKIIINNALND
ncbi:glycoside hydrolase family 5 protein [Aestuariibaculum suncheonense]